MTREEHLAWAKQRALEYVDHGDLLNAVTSMGSDLSKHPELKASSQGTLIYLGMMHANEGDTPAVRRWIEGFN